MTHMTTSPDVDILMVGHMAVDRIVVDGHSEAATGGGVFYGSMALRRLGVDVAVATRLHPRDYPRLDEMRRAGVRVFPTAAEATSGIENIYSSENMERRVCHPLAFAGAFQPEDVPDIAAKVIMISPIIAGEVGLPLLKTLADRAPLALDVQGFVRVPDGDSLVFRPWPDMAQGLARVTYLKVDLAEAEHLTGLTDAAKAAARLAAYGPREVVVTRSEGVLVWSDGQVHRAPFTPRSLAGRTGRGDTCFSTYVGWRLAHSAREATRLAGAVTTLKQEQPGPWRGTIEEALERAGA